MTADVEPTAGDAAPSVDASAGAGAASGGGPERSGGPHHWRRLLIIWAVASIAGVLLWLYLVGPHVPPGTMTSTADGAQFDFNVLMAMALPVLFGVWIYMIYAMVSWRASRGGPEPVGDARARGNLGLEWLWILVTTAIVLFLAGFGTYELVQPEGAGGGQGPNPIWTPASHAVLPVQVIGQQWKFTYRYPTFGGFETNELVLPDNTQIAFHVTSLDVIHSFWAYQLGVKADANPAQQNVAFTTTTQLGSFVVRCNELCGIWHGAMFNNGVVVTPSQFMTWARHTEFLLRHNTALLPPFRWVYVPDANGADGGYYPDNVDPYAKMSTYGAPQGNGTGTPGPGSPSGYQSSSG
jgi:cytochrome c oxidase subunit 2